MKKTIRRVSPPSKLNPAWDAKFRPCHTGVAIDMSLCIPDNPPMFRMLRASYLIPWETINKWSKAPRGKLVTVKRK